MTDNFDAFVAPPLTPWNQCITKTEISEQKPFVIRFFLTFFHDCGYETALIEAMPPLLTMPVKRAPPAKSRSFPFASTCLSWCCRLTRKPCTGLRDTFACDKQNNSLFTGVDMCRKMPWSLICSRFVYGQCSSWGTAVSLCAHQMQERRTPGYHSTRFLQTLSCANDG